MEKQEKNSTEELLKKIAELQLQMAEKQSKEPESTISDERFQAMEKKLREIDKLKSNKTMIFELLEKQNHRHFKGKFNVFVDGYSFQVRNTRSFDNPFVEMQDGDTEVRDDIHFIDGYLFVNPSDTCLFRVLMLSPYNEENGGSGFRLRDEGKIRKIKFEQAEAQFEAYSYLRELPEAQQKAAMVYITETPYRQIKELDGSAVLSELKPICDERPQDILALKNNPRVDITFVYSMAEAAGYLYHDAVDGFVRYKNKKVVFECSGDKSPAVEFANWVIKDSGGKASSVYEKMKTTFSYDKLSI